MHPHIPTGFSRPRPDIPEQGWRAYLQHCELLGTGRGMLRTISRTHDVGAPSIPTEDGGMTFAPIARDRGLVSRYSQGITRVIEVHDVTIGDPTEITRATWMRERLRGYVNGWASPPPLPILPFGPPETRFRPFSQEPYFPITGFFGRPLESTTRHNSFKLNRRIAA